MGNQFSTGKVCLGVRSKVSLKLEKQWFHFLQWTENKSAYVLSIWRNGLLWYSWFRTLVSTVMIFDCTIFHPHHGPDNATFRSVFVKHLYRVNSLMLPLIVSMHSTGNKDPELILFNTQERVWMRPIVLPVDLYMGSACTNVWVFYFYVLLHLTKKKVGI